MATCHACGRAVILAAKESRADVCPHCGADLGRPHGESWRDVARTGSLAEAGFLANDLMTCGIETRIHHSDTFSALHGAWVDSYVLQVTDGQAAVAADRIRQQTADAEADHRPIDGPDWYDQPDSLETVLWRPIALIVIAGVASFLLGERFGERRVRVDQPTSGRSLHSAVEAIGRPFTTSFQPGQPRHRLRFDARRDAWQLDTDSDGDGHYERSRFYPLAPAPH